MSAGGAAAQNKAQTDTQAQQSRQAAEDVRRNQALNREAGARVSRQVEEFKRSTPQAEEATANAGFMDALRKAQIKGDGGIAAPAAASSRFADEAGIAQTQGQAENKRTASQFARIDAPMYQRQREGRGVTDTGVDLSLLENRGAGQDFLSRLRMAMIQPDAGLAAGGQLLSGFGGAMSQRALPVKTPVKPRVAPSLAGAYDTSTVPAGAYYG
jgi:hypothetical protein